MSWMRLVLMGCFEDVGEAVVSAAGLVSDRGASRARRHARRKLGW